MDLELQSVVFMGVKKDVDMNVKIQPVDIIMVIEMETIKSYFSRLGLHDNRQGNKEPKTSIHKEKISRGNKENWKKRHNWVNTHKLDPTSREKAARERIYGSE